MDLVGRTLRERLTRALVVFAVLLAFESLDGPWEYVLSRSYSSVYKSSLTRPHDGMRSDE